MRRFRQRIRTIEALALLALARLLRLSIPMRRWSRVLGPTGPPAVQPLGDAPVGTEANVAAAVSSAARRVDANCLEQAFAASLMLRRRGGRGVVVIGLDRDDSAASPHAWLVGGSGRVVVGAELMHHYVPVSQFGRLGTPTT